MCEISKKDNPKIQIYIGMANSCKAILEYKTAITFYKKALQYAWMFKDKRMEIIIYDKIGLTYYL